MSGIPLELARTLAAVIDEGSMDAAAAVLRISPSAVSQRIKALESQLGQIVLVRAKPVHATAAGLHLVRLARQLDLLGREVEDALGLSQTQGTVPLAVNADSLSTWFLPAIAPIARAGRVAFDLHRDDQGHTARLLEDGTVMAAVTSQRTPVAGCQVRALGTMRYLAVAHPAFVSDWQEGGLTLDRAPVVDFDRKDDLQTEWLRSQGFDPALPPRHRVPSSLEFAQAIRLGFGWGMLPELQVREDLEDGALVPLGGAPVDVALFWQQWSLRSAVLDEVTDAVVQGAAAALGPALSPA